MRAPIVVLALVMAPFLTSSAQNRGKNHNESARHETSAKPKKTGATEKLSTQACAASNENQQGQHEGSDETCAPAPTPAPTPAPVGLAQIHGSVYNDLNGNGIQDPGEELSGWTVTLAGPLKATTTSAVDGSYAFIALPVGVYTVCAVVQGTLTPKSPTTGPCTGGFGWLLDVPASMPDLWYGSIDFLLK